MNTTYQLARPQILSLFDTESELLDIGLRFIFNHLVDEGEDVVTLNTEEDEGRSWVGVGSRISARDTAWIDEVFAIVLCDAMLVGVTTD